MTSTHIPSKALQYYLPKLDGFHNLTLREFTVPQPGPREVLVQIHAVSLNYRDLIIAQGTYPLPKRAGLVPCSDMAGAVVARGANVRGWAPGDRVTAAFAPAHTHGDLTPAMQSAARGGTVDGVLSEYCVFPVEALLRIPDYMSFEEASTLAGAGVTAYNALRGPSPLKGGDWVLVQGTGGVSIFALQIAAASGANVIVTSSSDNKLKLAKERGAQYLINYKTTPDWENEVLKITGGRGVDHVIEIGGPGTIFKSLAAVRMAGWIHLVGYLSAAGGDAGELLLAALGKAVMLRGILVGSRAQFEDMLRLFSAREIHPVVDKVFAFEQAQEAYKHLESQNFIGKIVIKVAKE